MRAQWAEIEAAARQATPPARIHAVDDPLHRLFLERIAPDLERIVVGDQALLVRARAWLAQWQPALETGLVSVADAFEATGAAEQLEQALQPSVPLAGGGSLIIQPTAAFTAIDVNGGGRRPLEANLAAAREVARQLRLRRIGGTAVVDFIDLPTRAARARVLAALRDALAGDPAPVQAFSMSRFGLVEISRKRTGPSLAQLLGRPCPTCDGAGTAPGLRWRAEALMRALAGLPHGARGGPRRAGPARLSERGGQGRLAGVPGPLRRPGRAAHRSVPCPRQPPHRGAAPVSEDRRQESDAGRSPRCPNCGRPRAHEYRPFCSARCRDVDLGRWFGEVYAVPAAEPGYDEQEDEDGAPAGNRPKPS